MIYQAGPGTVDVIRGMLQKAGVSFNKAQGVSKAEAEKAHADPEFFTRLVRRLTNKT